MPSQHDFLDHATRELTKAQYEISKAMDWQKSAREFLQRDFDNANKVRLDMLHDLTDSQLKGDCKEAYEEIRTRCEKLLELLAPEKVVLLQQAEDARWGREPVKKAARRSRR